MEEENKETEQAQESADKKQPEEQAAEQAPEEQSSGKQPEEDASEEQDAPADIDEPIPAELTDEPKDEKELEPPFEEAVVEKTKEDEDEEVEEKLEEEAGEKDDDSGSDKGKDSDEGKKEEPADKPGPKIFALRTTANREDQVMDFVTSNIEKKTDLKVYSVIRPHGMRGYIFVEAANRQDAETAAANIPYARGLLPKEVDYSEMEHMLEQVKHEVDIRKNDIAEIIAGPFKREQCKVTRVDKTKEEVVVELLEAAVPIPITVKMDAIKVIRREGDDKIEE